MQPTERWNNFLPDSSKTANLCESKFPIRLCCMIQYQDFTLARTFGWQAFFTQPTHSPPKWLHSAQPCARSFQLFSVLLYDTKWGTELIKDGAIWHFFMPMETIRKDYSYVEEKNPTHYSTCYSCLQPSMHQRTKKVPAKEFNGKTISIKKLHPFDAKVKVLIHLPSQRTLSTQTSGDSRHLKP
jgi:hypothetical protein